LYLCLLNFKIIATDKLHTDSFIHHFKGKAVFETKDIVDFYKLTEKFIKSTTINWRVYALVQKGVLQRIGRGKFKLGKVRKYMPEISSLEKSIFKKLKTAFPYANFCVWKTSVFNEFMQHQPSRFFLMVETDKEITNSVFYFLRDLKKSVFIDPTKDIMEKYVLDNKDVVLIKPLLSEAPTQKTNEIETVTLEKILVDLYCDEIIFSAQQGAEMRTIYKEAFAKYTINQSKMLRYASRRRKKEEVYRYVNKISNLWQHS